jgi:RimJ/RimL family protein N-acetyltransferase
MLQTERITLREWKDSDFAPFAAMNADAEVMRYFPGTSTKEESDNLARKFINHFAEHGFGLFATELKSTGEFIGFVGLNIPNFEAHFTPCVEIGWRLAKEHWNKGYATEAALAVIQYGFGELELKEIVSFTAVQNTPSRKVMEKIGMVHNPADDFDHPKLEAGHWLLRHVLYRKLP